MPISDKQKKILAFPYSRYDALICDGAVRSGKTSIMMWAFVRWAMENFSGQRFGVCGRTVDSCTKNIIVPFTAMSLAKERYIIRWRRGDKVMEVRRGAVTNYFEVFGGKDEASYTLIQGRTLAGVLLDKFGFHVREETADEHDTRSLEYLQQCLVELVEAKNNGYIRMADIEKALRGEYRLVNSAE